MSDCVICLCDFENGRKYTCCDHRCMEYVCMDCLTRYLEISAEENTLPTCPREGCKGVFDEPCIPESLVKNYRKLLHKHYVLVKTADILQAKKLKASLEILREEKSKFLIDSMPKAVAKVANLVFKTKINKVRKDQAKRGTGRILRTCINLVCNGFLNEKFICQKCNTEFCKSCEEKKDDHHVCDENAVKSVAMVAEMTSCPSCNVKIEKGEGCMAMTCAVCKTDFWYNTGEKSEFGNHNQSKEVKLRNIVRISEEYAGKIPAEYMERIQNIEKEVENPIEDPLRLRGDSGLLKLREFSDNYSKIVRSNLRISTALETLFAIEKILKTQSDMTKLDEILAEKRVSSNVVLSRDGSFLVLDHTTIFENVYKAGETLKIPPNEIRKAIEIGGGMCADLFWEYVE